MLDVDHGRGSRPPRRSARRRVTALVALALTAAGLGFGDSAVGALARSGPQAHRLVPQLAAPLLLPAVEQADATASASRDLCCPALVATLDGVLAAQRGSAAPTCRLAGTAASVPTPSATPGEDDQWTCTLRTPAEVQGVVLWDPDQPGASTAPHSPSWQGRS